MSGAGGAAGAYTGANVTTANPMMVNAELTRADFDRIAAIMQREARIALSPAKTTLVQSRLARRLRQHGLARYKDYLTLVDSDPSERDAMVVALTTNHTHFFREEHHFDHLREKLIPELKQRVAAGKPIRIWSVGCATGEEAYSIAMCLLGPDRASAAWLRNADVRLLATDISPPVVEAARRGVYTAQASEAVPDAYRRAWMQARDSDLVMAEEARRMVTANVLNLFGEWPLKAQYDAIFCRNVMIYFDDVAKAELEERLVRQLAPGGFLYIGHSERLIGAASQMTIPCGQTIYTKKGPPQ